MAAAREITVSARPGRVRVEVVGVIEGMTGRPRGEASAAFWVEVSVTDAKRISEELARAADRAIVEWGPL